MPKPTSIRQFTNDMLVAIQQDPGVNSRPVVIRLKTPGTDYELQYTGISLEPGKMVIEAEFEPGPVNFWRPL